MRTNLVQARKQKSLKQKEVAEYLDIATNHYQRLEAGTSDGSLKLWEHLKKLLGKSIDELVEND